MCKKCVTVINVLSRESIELVDSKIVTCFFFFENSSDIIKGYLWLIIDEYIFDLFLGYFVIHFHLTFLHLVNVESTTVCGILYFY